jgi:Ser/Thr protein kinase RdoA (MazF antagonist)
MSFDECGRTMTDVPEGAEPLSGGRLSSGVYRLGDTVRRPMSGSSDFTASLLTLLESRDFRGSPRFLGRVGGMDVLSFVPGQVPARFRSWTDHQVRAAAVLLRKMHDATRGSELAGRFDVVCHHDPGPNNAVFQDGVPVAFIDFDEAAPGSPLEDVAYLAWTWSISFKRAVPPGQQARQVRLVADAYGLEAAERHVLVDCVLERQSRNVRFWARYLTRPATAPPEVLADRIEWSRREHAFVHMHREVFDRALF